MDHVDVDSVYSLAMEVEDQAAALYRGFARRFHDDEDASGFWRRMSEDEDRHYHALGVARGLVKALKILSLEVDIDLAPLRALLDDLQNGSKTTADVTSEEALRLAWRIETSEADRLRELLTSLPNPRFQAAVGQFAQQIDGGEGQHEERLRRFARKMEVELG